MLRHLPNAITIARGVCGPLVMLLVVELGAYWPAFWVFLGAMATDLLDGYVARRLGAESRVALLLDPLSDKLLTDFTWASLAIVGFAPLWLATAFIARDVFVAAAWGWGWLRGRAWPALPSGQIGLAFEAVALSVLLFHGPFVEVHWPTVGAVLGTLALTLSLVQLLEYAGGRNPS